MASDNHVVSYSMPPCHVVAGPPTKKQCQFFHRPCSFEGEKRTLAKGKLRKQLMVEAWHRSNIVLIFSALWLPPGVPADTWESLGRELCWDSQQPQRVQLKPVTSKLAGSAQLSRFRQVWPNNHQWDYRKSWKQVLLSKATSFWYSYYATNNQGSSLTPLHFTYGQDLLFWWID